MTSDVTIGLAFVAGIISFISPCVLPLVPAYIGYMGGRVTQQIAQQTGGITSRGDSRQRFGTVIHGLFFVLGFTLFFVLFGLLTTAAVSSLTSLGVTKADVQDGIARIGGAAVILFGLHIMGVLKRLFTWLQKQAPRLDRSPYGNLISAVIALALIGICYWLVIESWFLTLVIVLVALQLFRDALKADTPGEFWSLVIQRVQLTFYVDTRRQNMPSSRYGYLGSLLMGVVFSAGWTPCIGPIYGAVLTLASSGGSIPEAGVLLTAYSLGLGIPFLLTALALNQAQGVLRRVQRHMRAIEAFSGAFLLLIGVLVFSGQLEHLTRLGASQGRLGDMSLNLENCVIGAFEGRVRWINAPDCVIDGPKDDFYLAAAKGASGNTPTGSPLDIPALDNTNPPGGLNVPELASGPDLEAHDGPEALPSASQDAPNVSEGLDIGQRAPDFSAQTPDGANVSLSDFRGQVVLLNFWATWCGPCRREMSDFQALYELYGGRGFVVLAVNNQESRSKVADFVEEENITFPVALDESGAINGALYGKRIIGYPASFLIDETGVIIDYFPEIVDAAELLDILERRLGP